MKTSQKISIVMAVILIMNVQLEAQDSKIDFSALKIGKSYKVTITTGWNAEGRLIRIDSNSIEIKTEYKIFTINKGEIEQITGVSSDFEEDNAFDLPEIKYKDKVKKDKLYFSVGSGVNFPTMGFDNGYDPGLNIQLDLMKIISPSYAIRGDLQFGQSTRKKHEYSYDANSSRSEGGNLNNYSLKFDFLLGELKPSSKTNAYGILGGGFNVLHQTERKYSGSYQDYNYSTNEYTTQTYSYTEKGSSIGEIVLGVGGGLAFKVSDKVRLFGEAQYSFPIIFLGQYGGFFPYSFLYGNPTLKIGAQIGL